MRMASARCLLLLLLVVVGGQAAKKRKISNWHLKVGQEQGANACLVEEIPGKNWKLWTECRYQNSREICGQKTRMRYECCGGYHQLTGQSGCPGVNPMVDVLQTAKHYGASKFVEMVEQAGLADRFKREGPFTLFAPIDSAFERLSNDKKINLVPTNRNKNSTILLHAMGKTVSMDDVGADTVLPSLYGLDLRINKYNNGMKTVNCILIVRKDLQASNGVVHLVENILEPYVVVQGKNLAEMIEQDGRFSELARALRGSKCQRKLENSQQSYSVLAPSDEAFQKIPQAKLERLLSNPDIKEALLDNHVIPHPTCLSAVTGKARQKTLGKEKLELNCDGKGVSVAGQRLRNSYQMGTNGLLYMVDDLILPQKAMGAMQLAENEKLFSFSQILRTSGMAETIESMPNVTIFAPSEAAMFSMPKEELQQLKENKEKARQFVMYHTVEGTVHADGIASDKNLRSMDRRNNLRLQVELNALGVEGARIEKRDLSGSNTCMHVISKTLRPPTESAEAVLRTMGNFTYFVKGLSHALKAANSLPSRSGHSLTIVVPTDKAFKEMPEEKLQQFATDRKFMNKILRGHIADHMVTFSMLKPGLKYLVNTKFNPVYFSVDKLGTKMIGEAEVLQGDITVSEGVIHIVDKVLLNGNGHRK